MIIQLVTRTFTSQKDANTFETFFCKQWKELIKNIPNCKLRIVKNKDKLNTFNAVWEFPDSFTQDKVMKLIKINNQNYEGVIAKKTTNFVGDVKKEFVSIKS